MQIAYTVHCLKLFPIIIFPVESIMVFCDKNVIMSTFLFWETRFPRSVERISRVAQTFMVVPWDSVAVSKWEGGMNSEWSKLNGWSGTCSGNRFETAPLQTLVELFFKRYNLCFNNSHCFALYSSSFLMMKNISILIRESEKRTRKNGLMLEIPKVQKLNAVRQNCLCCKTSSSGFSPTEVGSPAQTVPLKLILSLASSSFKETIVHFSQVHCYMVVLFAMFPMYLI